MYYVYSQKITNLKSGILNWKYNNSRRKTRSCQQKTMSLRISSESQHVIPIKAPNISASKTLVIGSSLVRKLDEAKVDRSEVRSLSGAKMRDIATELEAMASDGLKYSRVVIVAGGNDASQPIESMDLKGTMAAFNDAVKAAKELSSDVAVTEIPLAPNHRMPKQHSCAKCKHCGYSCRIIDSICVWSKSFLTPIKWHQRWLFLRPCTSDDQGLRQVGRSYGT